MSRSKQVSAVLRLALVAALALSGCSRRAQAETEVQAGSDVQGVSLVARSDLPRSPETGAADEYCERYRETDLTPTGRQVESQGWLVTSEAPLGRYRVVTFVSGFDPGTSGICTGRNANIGVFDGARLVALAYTPRASDIILGSVEPLEDGSLLVWGGDYPGPPLGELRVERDRLRLTTVAPAQTFCGRAVTVPNVYGQSIEVARNHLIAGGWRPLPPEEAPVEYDRANELARRGVIEAAACSGTGMGYCHFRYQGPGGVLEVTTTGDDHRVLGYGVVCPDA